MTKPKAKGTAGMDLNRARSKALEGLLKKHTETHYSPQSSGADVEDAIKRHFEMIEAEKKGSTPRLENPVKGSILDSLMTSQERILERVREIRSCAQDLKEKLFGAVPEKSAERVAPPVGGGFLGAISVFQDEIAGFEVDILSILHEILGKL